MTGLSTMQHADLLPERRETINELVDGSCRRFAEYPAVGMALEPPLSYREMRFQSLVLAAQLQSEGIGHGYRVALLAENSHRWGLAYLAIVRLGAVAVPILPDLPEADVHHILSEMGCDVIFTTQRQIEKIYELGKSLAKVVMLDDDRDKDGVVQVLPFSECIAMARQHFGRAVEEGQVVFPEVSVDDLACVLYTSGTSGFSKAVMLSHGNLTANAYAGERILSLVPGSIFLSVLPISHTYEFTVGFLVPLIKGCRVVYAGRTPTPAVLKKICAAERPHAMLVVPLIMEKIYKKRVLPAIEESGLLTFLCRFRWSRRLVYRKIAARLLDFFGGRLEFMGIGGAALNPEVEQFFHEAGFPYLIGYGLTEAAPLLAGGPLRDASVAVGSTGRPIAGVEIRIDSPDPVTGIGEVYARGPNIMHGYWNDREATEGALTRDGWLKTGDLGVFDAFGNLHLKGRSKSVIVLASGENVYPEAIEHKINAYPFVVESLVIDNKGSLEAWVYPDYEFIDKETQGQSRQQRHAYIAARLEQVRAEVNALVPTASRLSRLVERREPFIKTATHKIKRYLYSANGTMKTASVMEETAATGS